MRRSPPAWRATAAAAALVLALATTPALCQPAPTPASAPAPFIADADTAAGLLAPSAAVAAKEAVPKASGAAALFGNVYVGDVSCLWACG